VDEGLAWEDWVRAAAPETRMFDPVLTVGENIRRPIPPKCGFIRLRLARYSLHLQSGLDSERYARHHGLYTANPYHLLALVQHFPDIRATIDHQPRRGPGLFATDPVKEDNWDDQAVGVWFSEAGALGRAQVMLYEEILGGLTYFVFSKDPWYTN
jgi:hypothetical protein